MSARRRRKKRQKAKSAENSPSAARDPVLTAADTVTARSLFRAVLGWDDKRPIPTSVGAAFACFLVILLASKFSAYVACPQGARGITHIFTSIAVGLPVGGGVMAIVMIVTILGVTTERVERSIGAVRISIERAGIGAIYGTLMSTVATVNLPNGSACGTELLSNISNGATWGTMLGLMFSFVALRKQMMADANSAERPGGKWMIVNLANASLLFGAAIGLILIVKLLNGGVLPQ